MPYFAIVSGVTPPKKAPVSTRNFASWPLILTMIVGLRPSMVTGTSANFSNWQAAPAAEAVAIVAAAIAAAIHQRVTTMASPPKTAAAQCNPSAKS